MKKGLLIALAVLLTLPLSGQAASLAETQSGKILLQVERNGEAWYVFPPTNERFYMGRPADAFQIMRELGLGIKHDLLKSYLLHGFPDHLSGRIMLDVEKNGEAYYVYPDMLEGHYLGRPADAFQIMRNLGLGITDQNLIKIQMSDASAMPPQRPYFYGPVDAPVTVTVYEDFQDPFSLNHQYIIHKALNEFYGDVQYEYRHFPLSSIHPLAQKAAEALECANEQGYFWEMHRVLYLTQAYDTMSIETWKKFPTNPKYDINAAQFNECLDSGKYKSLVGQQKEEGMTRGVTGTPYTFVNGTPVAGAVPYEQFREYIIDELNKQ